MSALNAIQLPIGADVELHYTVFTDATQTVVRDVSGFSFRWLLKRHKHHTDAQAIIVKDAAITVPGAFNASPAINTEVVVVPIAYADTVNLAPGPCFAELKRIDAGLKTPLSPEPDQIELTRGVVRA